MDELEKMRKRKQPKKEEKETSPRNTSGEVIHPEIWGELKRIDGDITGNPKDELPNKHNEDKE